MELTCYVFPDLLPWERACLAPVMQSLSAEIVEVGEYTRGALKNKKERHPIWLVARDWQGAITVLQARRYTGPVWVSVLDSSFDERPLVGILYRNFFSSLPPNIRLLVHSPIAYRFFREVMKTPESQVHLAPLAAPQVTRKRSEGTRPFTIGALGALTSDTGFHSILLAAHYVAQREGQIQFQLAGLGPLYPHLQRLITELGLGGHVSIGEGSEPENWQDWDALIYAPSRNDHFAELLVAGSLGLPVLAADIPGLSDFIEDGRSGFVLPVHDTKPMGELALRLAHHPELAITLGQKLKERVETSFKGSSVLPRYQSLFFGASYQYKNFRRAA